MDSATPEDHYQLSTSPQSGRHTFNDHAEEISSDVDDHHMMIQNPMDSLPIVLPQRSSLHLIPQQKYHPKRSQFPSNNRMLTD